MDMRYPVTVRNGLGVYRAIVPTRPPFSVRDPRHHSVPAASYMGTLAYAKYAYVRVDGHRTPLQRPYQGPFLILQRGDKTYELMIKGKSMVVSIDRLKPASVLNESTSMPSDSLSPPITVTRSGRVSQPPRYFSGGEAM